MSATAPATFAIVEMSRPGMEYAARLHAAGCRDIDRDRARGYSQVTAHQTTPEAWLGEVFGDVASDSGIDPEADPAAWAEELREQAVDVTVCACARAAGFTF